MVSIVNSTDNLEDSKWNKNMRPVFAFQRASSMKNLAGAVGIGLSTVNALVEEIKGSFEIQVKQPVEQVEAIVCLPSLRDTSSNVGLIASFSNKSEEVRRYIFRPEKRVSSDDLDF
jgi:hypothetical protein